MQITTKSGFSCDIDPDVLNNMELVDDLADARRQRLAFPRCLDFGQGPARGCMTMRNGAGAFRPTVDVSWRDPRGWASREKTDRPCRHAGRRPRCADLRFGRDLSRPGHDRPAGPDAGHAGCGPAGRPVSGWRWRGDGARQLLQAAMLDRLTTLCWMQSKDGAHGRRRPPSVVEASAARANKQRSGRWRLHPAEFERARAEIIKKAR